MAARGRALPGAAAALAAVAALGPAVVQSVLTGNVPAMARAKLAAFGLGAHLDLDIGAYGDHHEVRAELVHLARGRARAAYGQDFGGQATVLVGDTPLDVEAALATGRGRSASPPAARPPPSWRRSADVVLPTHRYRRRRRAITARRRRP
jgi:phosphoglycolate phosphatase-like HAD superfamily hydrolase